MQESLERTVPIIILNWNGLEDTIECMTSVLRLKKINYEVYLVDNNSDHSEGEILKKTYGHEKNVRIILNNENLGFTRGNNTIMKQLVAEEKYEYIALLNNDTVVTPDWLFNLIDSAQKNRADMIASKMIDYYDRSIMDNAGHFMLNTAEILPVGHGQPINQFNKMQQNIGACGGGALYSTKLLKSIGFFDEFFDTGYEDAEFGLRANKSGFFTIFEPSAILYHKVSRSIKKIKNDAYFMKIQRNIFYTYAKLMPIKYVCFNLPFIILKYLFLFIGTIITLRFNVIKLHIGTIYSFFTRDLNKVLNNRKEWSNKHRNYFSNEYLNRIHFFLSTDIKRLSLMFSKISRQLF